MIKVGLILACVVLPAVSSSSQQITLAPQGPFHVAGKYQVDAHGITFPLRGTELPAFHPQTVARDTRVAADFGPHSATSLAAIRLRFNMNAVRIPVDVADSERDDFFPELKRLVRRAHDTELLVILVAREPGAAMPSAKTITFWRSCAAHFRDDPNVLFDLFSFPNSPSNAEWAAALNPLIAAIRGAGATQPIIAMRPSLEGITALLDDPGVIYEATPRESDTRTDRERDAQFGRLADRVPVIAAGWDLELGSERACRAIPEEPGAATALAQNTLNYYDAHDIGWTVSVFTPGRLIKDLADHDGTSLENGWTCGRVTYPAAGIGRVVQAHLRAAEERGLYVVGAAGGLDVPRGGFAIAYGPAMAKRDAHATGSRLPVHLAGIAVHVTDSKGVSRPAGILYTSAGWGQINFVIPDASATGPARMTIVRDEAFSHPRMSLKKEAE
jgi:hypothetical protein